MYPFLFEKLKNSFNQSILMGGSVTGSENDVLKFFDLVDGQKTTSFKACTGAKADGGLYVKGI